ncbi:glycosyltransferase family 2 protein [Winogradskyella sp. PG-2]|uniref:glycosyltransferase family 2 protein n=1 Tax=Winogradskyella sp. PG-2 TaxID=754409 RepID=UPI0004586299|nr:glycosyltransferase family 2 protein [Winogradskyella sp. PG-2]BAO76205.1 colanic acid biosynthesis glycosyl transferase WcaE [Winogradskyella sp. PG-2]
MKVSIITATYNSEETIKDCMNSVLNQTHDDIEYIIMDGGSEDNTVAIIEKAAKTNPSIFFKSEPDKGIYDALNKGIAWAQGEVIGFVHSDDFLANNDIIKDIVETFNKENSNGVYGNLHYVAFYNTDKIIRNWVSKPYNKKLLKKGWMPAHPTLFLKKEIYDTYGLFNMSYKIAADYDFILRVFQQKDLKFSYIDKTIIKMRVGGASNGSFKNIVQKTKEDLKAIKENNVGGFGTIILKNITKIKQFIPKN